MGCFYSSSFLNFLEFFYIPPPAAEKMSAKDVQDFYELVTTIKSITNDVLLFIFFEFLLDL